MTVRRSFLAIVRRKETHGQRSAFPSEPPRFTPPGSSTIELPVALAESIAYSPDRARRGTLAPAAAPHQAFRDNSVSPSLPLACRLLPKGTKLELERGPTGGHYRPQPTKPPPRLNRPQTASWWHLFRVSPDLHPPERPSDTHTP